MSRLCSMSNQCVSSSSRLSTIKPCRRSSHTFLVRKYIAMDSKKQSSTINRAASAGAAMAVHYPKPVFGETDCSYEWMNSVDFKGIDSLSLAAGKTLGSGTYAKVKAAWSTTRNEMVGAVTSVQLKAIFPIICNSQEWWKEFALFILVCVLFIYLHTFLVDCIEDCEQESSF